MANVTGPLTAGTLVKAATHASASSQYGKLITSSTKGTAVSPWYWDTANVATGKLIDDTNLKKQNFSATIRVNWTVPQTGVKISCTGCSDVTNTTAYTGTTNFTVSTTAVSVTVQLTAGSGANCGKYYDTKSATVGNGGTTTVTSKIPYYVVNGSSYRSLMKVTAADLSGYGYPDYLSGTTWTHNSAGVGEAAGFGPSAAVPASAGANYSTWYATFTTSGVCVLGSNPSTDGKPWLNDSYATWQYSSGTVTKTVSKAANSCYSVLASSISGCQISCSSWYLT